MYSRRAFIKLSTLFSATAALPLLQACQRRAKNSPNAPLRIGYLAILDATPLLIAHSRGLFSQYGVESEKPVLFRSWSGLIEAFLSGEVNLIHLLSPMSIWLRYGSQASIKGLMWNHQCGAALTVLPHIHQISDLSEKTLAIPHWYSIHNLLLQYVLRQNNLQVVEKNPKKGQSQLILMNPADMLPALANQHIAGYIVAEPFNALAEAKGVGKILRYSGEIWQNHACCINVMQQHDIDNRPDWVQQCVNALVEACAWANENRQDCAQLLAKEQHSPYTPHSRALLEQVLTQNAVHYCHHHWQSTRIAFNPYPYQSHHQKLIELLKQTHLAGVHPFLASLEPRKAAAELFDTRFIERALASQSYFRLPDSHHRQERLATGEHSCLSAHQSGELS